MKIIIGFPLEGQKVAAPDGLPRAICMIPEGAKVIHLGIAFPSSLICVFALVDPPTAEAGKPPAFKGRMTRMEFIVASPGHSIPDDFLFRAPIRTRVPPAKEGDPPEEGLVFVFEKQAPKLMIVTPRGQG